MDKLKVGDVVRLKSGGPVMTVFSYADTGITATGLKGRISILSETKVVCQWFDGSTLMSSIFDIGSIEYPK